MEEKNNEHSVDTVKRWLRIVIFGTKTKAGRLFDAILLVAIVLSVLVIMLESVREIREPYGVYLRWVEWFFTGLFTVEYFLRIYLSERKRDYVLSLFGIIDLLAILPAWLFFVLPGGQFLSTFRILRVIRVFRVFELAQFSAPGRMLLTALRQSSTKIFVFLFTVILLVSMIGSLMYVVEGPENGFVSIPMSAYWAVVTITTVGYGDIYPVTAFGKLLAGLTMIIGYSIIAIPTGVVSAQVVWDYKEGIDKSSKASKPKKQEKQEKQKAIKCPSCEHNNDLDAKFCSQCGVSLIGE